MKNATFTKTVEGVSDFLKGVKKTYGVSSGYPRDIIRHDAFDKTHYHSTMTRVQTKGNISYRINLIPDEKETQVVLVVDARTYSTGLKYKEPTNGVTRPLEFLFTRPQRKLTFTWDLSKFKNSPMEAEALIDEKIQSVVNEDFKEIFSGYVLDSDAKWKLTVEGGFEQSYEPLLDEKYVLE